MMRRTGRLGMAAMVWGCAVMILGMLETAALASSPRSVALPPAGGEASPEDTSKKIKIQEDFGKLPLSFIDNRGQLPADVLYYEKGAGHAVYFTRKEMFSGSPSG